MRFATSFASSAVNTVPPDALGIPVSSRILSKSSRSSAASTSSALVPRIGTPIFIKASVSLIAVCPPNCTTAPSGFSMFTMLSTSSAVNGSKYNLSAISKSVETVSGLLFTIMVSQPSFAKAQVQCTLQKSNSIPCPIRIGPEPSTKTFFSGLVSAASFSLPYTE